MKIKGKEIRKVFSYNAKFGWYFEITKREFLEYFDEDIGNFIKNYKFGEDYNITELVSGRVDLYIE